MCKGQFLYPWRSCLKKTIYLTNWLQEWELVSVVGQIIASQNKAVCWTTPLGLPVVQPYRKNERHLVIALLTSLISWRAQMVVTLLNITEIERHESLQVKTTLQVLTLQRETEKVTQPNLNRRVGFGLHLHKVLAELSQLFCTICCIVGSGYGKEADDSFCTKFCTFPWWVSHDDDSSRLQQGGFEFCRSALAFPYDIDLFSFYLL